jgi:FixJ family two-component response regulator
MTDPRPNVIIGVVDDDLRVLESLENLLESADYGVRLFSSAKALLESTHFPEMDCLISDINMPVMDGCDLLRAVNSARPELPIILITGYPEMLHRLPPIDLAHHQLFKKPFNGQELLAAVSKALQNRAQHRPSLQKGVEGEAVTPVEVG